MLKRFGKNKLLTLILLTTFLKGIIWSLVVPIWHFPDEQAHFAQISYFVETGKMPPDRSRGGDLSEEILISERILGTKRDWQGINKFTYHPEYNLEYTGSTLGKYEKEIASLPISSRQQMVKYEAAAYPPLYYWLMGGVYKLAYYQDLFTRVVLIRLFNVIFFIALVFTAKKLFDQIFPDKLLALTATIMVSFHPMLTFVASGINSDNLHNLLFTFALTLAATLLKAPLSFKRIILIGIITFLSIQTKPQGVLMVYIFAYPLLFQFIHGKLATIYKIAIVLLGILLSLKIIIPFSRGEQILPDVALISVKLPTLTIVDHLRWTVNHTVHEVIPWYWGIFKWLGVTYPRSIHRIINYTSIMAGIGTIIYLWKIIRRKQWSKLSAFLLLLYASGGYFLILTTWDYLFTRSVGFTFGIQGRYFFPTIAPHIGLLLLGLSTFSQNERTRNGIAKLIGIGMIILNGIALYIVASSYYTNATLHEFFIQASQYKPAFAKSPFLEGYFILYGIILVYFLTLYVNYKLKSKQ